MFFEKNKYENNKDKNNKSGIIKKLILLLFVITCLAAAYYFQGSDVMKNIKESVNGKDEKNYTLEDAADYYVENNDVDEIVNDFPDDKTFCYIAIDCKNIYNHIDDLEPTKKQIIPEDGYILKKTKVEFEDGDTVYDILVKVCKEENIQIESTESPTYSTVYIEGIANIYEFDCGSTSGWMYSVNDEYINYGCSNYKVKAGDDIKWTFSCVTEDTLAAA